MRESRTHRIGEQNTAYRRGIVLGLTMAEVGILIIFVLLLLIALRERRLLGARSVPTDRLAALEQAESTLSEIRSALGLHEAASEEITRLVRSLAEIAATSEARSTLEKLRAVQEELARIREAIGDHAAAEQLMAQVEQLTFRVSNQEGQLRRYEKQLKESGSGQGQRACWVKPDGTIEYLYEVVLASNGIRMREYVTPERAKERSTLPMPKVDPRETMQPDDFLRRTQPLYEHGRAANCRFLVVVYDATGPTEKERYKKLLTTVEGHFFKRLDNDAAPF